MPQFRKIAENEASDQVGHRVVIENGYSVTYYSDDDKVYLAREIRLKPSGASAGSLVDLSIPYDWESGRAVTRSEINQIARDLKTASNLLDADFLIISTSRESTPDAS
ncbi:hypothetical protein [Novosphingobium album (ex Liu et al. 2023)]|uniref:Uncharacterized protein n=1 Tax=Novosphingobium album (ex Liu et al. 2023) TaxID=3031130 RepID=A0ABT5WUW7_9SPHN|nr:hypothetical protein [Novosphingobium album (ex Liu et al. 2023)]MDE8653695.1 hypothetical protein [Novosphingobium album (ex Liu et al. 2023)]